MKQKTYNQLTCVIFLVITGLHILRLVLGWSANIAGWEVPMWLSVVAIAAGAFLAWSAYKLEKHD